MIAINKADGDNVVRAKAAAAEYQGALNILTPQSATWTPPVLTISGRDNTGLDEIWARICRHRDLMTATGEHAARRQRQAVAWMHDMLTDRLLSALRANAAVATELPRLEADVREARLLPTVAVERILALMGLP
jgi:LAO/AO transport system kinase